MICSACCCSTSCKTVNMPDSDLHIHNVQQSKRCPHTVLPNVLPSILPEVMPVLPNVLSPAYSLAACQHCRMYRPAYAYQHCPTYCPAYCLAASQRHPQHANPQQHMGRTSYRARHLACMTLPCAEHVQSRHNPILVMSFFSSTPSFDRKPQWPHTLPCWAKRHANTT